jgi:hypothetical protein
MTKAEFQLRFWRMLDETLDEDPGPRAVGRIIAADLVRLLCNKSRCIHSASVEEVMYIMRRALADA